MSLMEQVLTSSFFTNFAVCYASSFSCTEGATWATHNFSDVNMNVDGVVNEPGIRTLLSR